MSNTITYGGVVFLCHKEPCEVRKGKTDEILYYTRQDTGESRMSVNSLASACGVGHPALLKFLNSTFLEVVTKIDKNDNKDLNTKPKEVVTTILECENKPTDFYLIKVEKAHIIRDIYCERIIYYYAFESNYKKTKARELYQSLAQHGLRVFIQSKAGYQIEQAINHDNSLILSIDEQLKKEVAELKLQLVEQQTTISEHQSTIKQLARKVEDLEYVPHLEKTYQAHLHGMIGGTRELHVSGPYPRRVDIATDQIIVEVKKAEEFEKAFGQLLRYRVQLQSTEHANKTYSIFLFGNVTQPERDVLEAMASMTNFQLIIHKDIKDFVDEDELSIREKIRIVS